MADDFSVILVPGSDVSMADLRDRLLETTIYLPDQVDLIGSMALGTGLRSLDHTTGDEGRYNVAVGRGAMLNAVGSYYNTAVGDEALKNGKQFGETAIGFNALYNDPVGSRYDNTALGALSLLNMQTGIDNVAIGIKAMMAFESGSENTCAGGDVMEHLVTGTGNTAFGNMAGRFLSDGTTEKTAGSNSVYIGWRAWGGPDNAAVNEIVIGNDTRGEGSNTVVLGNSDITDTFLKGIVRCPSITVPADGPVVADTFADPGETVRIYTPDGADSVFYSPASFLFANEGGGTTHATLASSGLDLNTGSTYKIGGTQVIGARGAAVADLTSTATSGSLPTPDGSVTIANAATPTNAELLEYCVELEAKVEAMLARMRAHGLIA